MAKIRVKGIGDFIEVPQRELELFAERKRDGTVGIKEWTKLGRWEGEAGNVTTIILDEKVHDPQFHGEQDFQRERQSILALDIDSLADRQRRWFDLIYHQSSYKPSEEDWQIIRELGKQFLIKNKAMMWVDPVVWVPFLKSKGLVKFDPYVLGHQSIVFRTMLMSN